MPSNEEKSAFVIENDNIVSSWETVRLDLIPYIHMPTEAAKGGKTTLILVLEAPVYPARQKLKQSSNRKRPE